MAIFRGNRLPSGRLLAARLLLAVRRVVESTGTDRPKQRIPVCQCGVPFARAPSLCLGETIRDQMLVYHQLERLAFSISPDVIGILAEEYIDELSASDLRGTNPANPADRHNAIMEEGWRLYGAWEQARAARAAERRARVKRRKAATESAATMAQTGASSS